MALMSLADGSKPMELPSLKVQMPPKDLLPPTVHAAQVMSWTTNPFDDAPMDSAIISMHLLDKQGSQLTVNNLAKPIEFR